MGNIMLNTYIISKLDGMIQDIKSYLNMDYGFVKYVNEKNNDIKCLDKEEIDELIDIRIRMKILSKKLKNKMIK